MRVSLQILIAAWSISLVNSTFNPREYSKKRVTCNTWHRKAGTGEPEPTTIQISYVDINPNAENVLLFVHGWLGLWSMWARQIEHFQSNYRLIIPDLRGFGDSSHPGDVQASGSHADIISDLICVLDDATVEKAVCIGHDWGSQLCYESARMRPDRIEGVVGAVLPYIPASGNELISVENLAKILPKLSYNIYFEKDTQKAVDELNADIRRTLRGTLRSVSSPPPDKFLRSKTSFLKAYKHMEEIPPIPFLSQEEEDYYVEQYEKQRFDHTLQFYTYENRFRNWNFAHQQGNWTIPIPSLSILPVIDPVADWPLVALILGSAKHLPYLTTRAIPTAHWPHLEKPQEFNAIMESWLSELDVRVLEVKLAEKKLELEKLKRQISTVKRQRSRVNPIEL